MTTENHTGPQTARGYVLARQPQGVPVIDDFELVEKPIPELAENQFIVANEYFSIDASMRLRMTPTPSPYLPPYPTGAELDGWAVGSVIASRSDRFAVGDHVVHYLGWRDYALLDGTQEGWTAPRHVAVDDTTLAQHYLGPLGPSGLTSWAGLLVVGELREGDVVYVSAAAGAIGGLAVQIAKLKGHRVIASAGTADKVRSVVEDLGADAAFNYREESVAAGLARLAPDGIDLYYDNVGGDHLDAALEAMRPGGRIALCGAIGDYNSDESDRPGIKHLFKAIERGLTLRGFLARMYADRWEEFHDDVAGWIADGKIVYPETIAEGLETAPQTFISLLGGANVGKTLVHLPG